MARAGESAGRVYVAAGAHWWWAAARVDRPEWRAGAAAAHAARALRDRDAGAAPAIAGDPPDGVPPAGWRTGEASGLAAMARGPAPIAVAPPGQRCDCATPIAAGRDRIAAVYAVTPFEVGDERAAVRALTLRLRYRDGVVVWLNGVEVARRHVAADASPVAFASIRRGTEWETFTIPAAPGLLRAGTNWLAVEVRPGPGGEAVVFDAELAAGTAARIARGPIVQRVGRTSATIVVDTDLPAAVAVDYGPTPALGETAVSASGEAAVHHRIELADLPPSSLIYYRVRAGADTSPVVAFALAPGPDEPLRVALYGDARGGDVIHRALLDAMLAEAPDLVVSTGDLVYRGTDAGDWQRFFAIAGDLLARVPYYPAVGNHDLGASGDDDRRIGDLFALWPGPADRPPHGHWYAFDVAGVHFVMLDSNAYDAPEQVAWLERDLAAARTRGVRAIIVATHAGPFSRGAHLGDPIARDTYVPILAAYGVDLVVSGHDHLYQRGRAGGVAYVVTGGGGAPLYGVRCGPPTGRACPVDDGAERVVSAHHWILLTVYTRHMTLCARYADGAPVEPCVTYRLTAKPAASTSRPRRRR
ncbi:MAG: hypothetical protein D6689_02235 [Deltaproteobacteria bacterium]|nr:MAG: hypothetical protein D6689_02235 [Deltaproteobacteria bacterium]